MLVEAIACFALAAVFTGVARANAEWGWRPGGVACGWRRLLRIAVRRAECGYFRIRSFAFCRALALRSYLRASH
jgi:hypothetical protein